MRGFTLVELLVVVLIIGLGVTIIGINVGSSNQYQLRVDAKRFANAAALLAEEAALTDRQWGIDFFRDYDDGEERFGYRWLVRSTAGRWESPYDESLAEIHYFTAGIGMRLQLDALAVDQEIEQFQQVPVQLPEGEGEKNKGRPGIIDENNNVAKAKAIKPEIWLLSSGEMNAFVLTLFDAENTDSYIEVTGDELGRISVDAGRPDEL